MIKRLLCLLVALASTLAVMGEAFGATRIVDDDGRASPPSSCGAATPTFNMIEPAVEASNPGDTVNVCPGTYPEQVSVEADENGLTLRSLVYRAAVIKAPPVMTDPGDVVTINGAQNVTLRDFTVAGPLPDTLFCSLFLRTGVRVIGGGSAIVRGNRITEMRSASPALRGCQNGFGLAIGRQSEGQTGSATAFDNQIDLYQKGGVYVDNVGSSLDLQTSLVQGGGPDPQIAQNGSQISRGATATVRQNRVQDHTYTLAPATGGTGVLLSQAAATTAISNNTLVRNDWNLFAGATSGIRILRNTLLDATFFDGIRMRADTSNNRIEENFLRNNAEHDCHDDSVGTGTAGTANFWIRNDGLTENRPGLCQPQQEECPDDDEDNDGLRDDRELALLTLLGNPDSDLDGVKDGNDDANHNDRDDEDEDDDDDPCPNDSDHDGEDDEDEDDEDDDDDD